MLSKKNKKGQIKSIANVSRHRDGETDVWVDGFRSKAWERFVSNFWMISKSMIGWWNVKANTSELFGWLVSPLEKVFGLRCKRAVFTHRLRGSTRTVQKHSVIWIVNLANDWFSREFGPAYSAHVKNRTTNASLNCRENDDHGDDADETSVVQHERKKWKQIDGKPITTGGKEATPRTGPRIGMKIRIG